MFEKISLCIFDRMRFCAEFFCVVVGTKSETLHTFVQLFRKYIPPQLTKL